ncbi:hypothetical protein B566_EDAN004193 [Ephemera danica]|nr:hypothetical protein B566_EDAN004193 [Ephemera danica]
MRSKIATVVVLLIAGFCPTSRGAAVSAPDDSEVTIIPPSLVYDERPPVAVVSGSRDEVVETQHSTCHISTEELVASARATVTRVLKGLCNAREMDDRLHNLEVLIGDQMTVIKTMLLSLEERVGDVDNAVKRIGTGTPCACDPQLQSHPPHSEDPMEMKNAQHRDSEIQLFNSSIHFISTPPDLANVSSEPEQRVFTYYWRIRDMYTKLQRWESRRSIRSPSFYISPSSYKLYIRLYPRQNSKNVYLHVGLTRGEYDAMLDWPFKLKHRITVLDQREESVQDIFSRIWDPTVLCSGFNWKRPLAGDNHECVGLGFPHEVLKSRNYILGNTMVVKLTVYLDL